MEKLTSKNLEKKFQRKSRGAFICSFINVIIYELLYMELENETRNYDLRVEKIPKGGQIELRTIHLYMHSICISICIL